MGEDLYEQKNSNYCYPNSNTLINKLDIKDDKINFEQLAIPYNVDKVIKEIRKLKFPFYEGILKIFYGDRN